MINVDKIEKLMSLMREYEVDVVQAEEGGESIRLARKVPHTGVFHAPAPYLGSQPGQNNSGSGSSPSAQQPSPSTQKDPIYRAPEPAVGPGAGKSADVASKYPNAQIIKSPFVGTFYRAPSPDSPVFVDVGTRVRKGQSLCIVEAMKLMNEIESELDGEVVAILIENGKPVEFGTPLFVVNP